MLRPRPGDCCVFCSYAEHHCIERQIEAQAQNSDSHSPAQPGQ